MNKMLLYSGVMVLSALIASISQVLLKKAARKQHSSKLREYLNIRVIFAYSLFVLTTLTTVYSLKYIPLSMAAILESTGYIFVGILSYFFLGERLKGRQLAGMAVIIAGIAVYSMG